MTIDVAAPRRQPGGTTKLQRVHFSSAPPFGGSAMKQLGQRIAGGEGELAMGRRDTGSVTIALR
jgi:hypothetical protein